MSTSGTGDLRRREFIRLLAGGTAGLGLGLVAARNGFAGTLAPASEQSRELMAAIANGMFCVHDRDYFGLKAGTLRLSGAQVQVETIEENRGRWRVFRLGTYRVWSMDWHHDANGHDSFVLTRGRRSGDLQWRRVTTAQRRDLSPLLGRVYGARCKKRIRQLGEFGGAESLNIVTTRIFERLS